MPDEIIRPEATLRRFGPKPDGHPGIGMECYACKVPFKVGDYTTIIALGPGEDGEERAKAMAGRAYNAIAIEIHWACATGDADA